MSRNVDPLRSAVVSVTKIHAGDAYNIVPARITHGGGIRSFEPATREFLRSRIVSVVDGVAKAMGAEGRVEFGFGNPAVFNEARSTALAARVAAEVVGADCVEADAEPVLGSEDFAFMLERKPGCYVFIGNGAGEGSCMIHNPGYDFNDAILSLGASYWVRLAQAFLAERST